jgi:hypothetical protein
VEACENPSTIPAASKPNEPLSSPTKIVKETYSSQPVVVDNNYKQSVIDNTTEPVQIDDDELPF